MLSYLSVFLIVLFALYLLALAILSQLKPKWLESFLRAFAQSAQKHYLEMLLRAVLGFAFLFRAPEMLYSTGFIVFAWVLLLSSAFLLLLPWGLHQKFAQWVVPPICRYLSLLGWVSMIMSLFILWSLFA